MAVKRLGLWQMRYALLEGVEIGLSSWYLLPAAAASFFTFSES